VINEDGLECKQICQHTKIVEGVTWRCRSENTNIRGLANLSLLWTTVLLDGQPDKERKLFSTDFPGKIDVATMQFVRIHVEFIN
jgi:hypothetical protein